MPLSDGKPISIQNNSLKFSFIGCGNIAHFHAEVVLALGHRVSSVCARLGSQNIDSFAKKFSVPTKYYNYMEMIESDRPDALILCSSWNQTENILNDILKVGLPILVEKPVALTSKKIKYFIDDESFVTHKAMVGYNRRHYDFIPKLKERISSGGLISVEMKLPESATSIINKKGREIENHILTYMSSHWFDLLIYLIGEVEIIGLLKEDSSYHGLLKSLSGDVPVHYISDFDSFQNTSLSFTFKDSVWELCPIELLTIYDGLEVISPSKEYPIRSYRPKKSTTQLANMDYKPGFFKQMKFFINNYISGPGSTDSFLDAYKVTKLCESIREL